VENETPLHIAAKMGNEVILEMLLRRPDIQANCLKRGTEQTPLMLATREGHARAVQVLLSDRRVDVNTHDKYTRRAIHYAALTGSLEIVKLLATRKNLYARAEDAGSCFGSCGNPLCHSRDGGQARKKLLKSWRRYRFLGHTGRHHLESCESGIPE
jgi:ankyrin repeat protein